MNPFRATLEQPAADELHPGPSIRRAYLLLSGIALLITTGLLVYSETMAFVWDEGFHLLTAQLIDAGKLPYIDFCFPQTPLNAYWNAAWMHVFGQNWRVTHVFAALLVAGCVFLITDFVFARFAVPRWRLASAVVVALFVGLNTIVVEFGTVAQAYGMCLFLTVASFRAAIGAVHRPGVFRPITAGLLAGAAAGSSLLTAPVAPVLLLWMLFYNTRGNRWTKCTAFVAGTIIPFLPVLWLFVKAPYLVFFNIVQYQALFRRVDWAGATPHDVDVLSGWLNSTQALLMGFLAIAGVVFLVKKSAWDRQRRAEFYLCGWLAVALIAYIATAHPTFERYFVFVVPFLSAIATVGLYAVGSQLAHPDRPFWPSAIISLLIALALAKGLFDDRDSATWKDYEDIAKKVNEVTPRDGRLYADELVYFLLRRTPPPGMEFSYGHKLDLPPARAAALHLVSDRELKNEITAGKFDTVQTCNDDKIDEIGLPRLFPHKADVGDCTIFSGKVQHTVTVARAK